MRILLVEDDEKLYEPLISILEKNHINVDHHGDGESGLLAAQSGIYDVIVLDVMLPKMDGFTVCRKLREKISTPIIMITAKQRMKLSFLRDGYGYMAMRTDSPLFHMLILIHHSWLKLPKHYLRLKINSYFLSFRNSYSERSICNRILQSLDK